jgi:hypothetical protein
LKKSNPGHFIMPRRKKTQLPEMRIPRIAAVRLPLLIIRFVMRQGRPTEARFGEENVKSSLHYFAEQ